MGLVIILVNLALGAGNPSLQFTRIWQETRAVDFADGSFDPLLYVSLRAQLEGDSGCVEFVPRFDLNNDGYIDLVCSDDSGPYLRVYLGSAQGYLPENCRLLPVVGGGNVDIADLDVDGYPELIHSGWRSGHITIYRGTDSGPSGSDTTWLLISGQSEAVAVCDLDQDAYLDIIAGSDNGMIYIFWGGADGYRSDRRTTLFLNGSVGHNLEIADFDRDGYNDIVASLWSRGQAPIIYWGAGRSARTIVWLPVSPNNPHGVTVADLNDDGWLDLVFTGYDTVTTAFIYYGSAQGFSVSNRELIHPGQCYGGSAAALWNYDKTLDLVFFRGDWGRNVAYRPRVYFNRPDTTPHFSDDRYSEVGEVEFNASGGFIADFNYDGFQDIFVNNMMPDSASFVLWGPGFLSYNALPVDRDHHGMWREIGNVYTRGKYASYLSSVYYTGDSVIAGGSCSWVAYEPSGSAVVVSVRAGDTPVPDSTWTQFLPVPVNGGQLPAAINGRNYLQYQITFIYSRACYLPHLEAITFYLNLVVRPDAELRVILAPAGVVDSGAVVAPAVVVAKAGGGMDTVLVRLGVGGFYRDSVAVVLDAGAVDTVYFRDWVASPVGVHPVVADVRLAGDRNPANDTAYGWVEVRRVEVLDAGVVQILAPTGVVDSGEVITPRVLVANFGNTGAFVPVHFSIGTGYADTLLVNIPAGDTVLLTFRNWTASPVGRWSVMGATVLPGDENPANDTVWADVEVVVRPDAELRVILAPAGVVDSGAVVAPAVVVAKAGGGMDTVLVRLGVGGFYRDSVAVVLDAGAVDTVYFRDWVASPVGVHPVVADVRLAGDRNPANDTAYGWVEVRRVEVLDAGVVQILAPTGVVDSGEVITPRVLVANFGNTGAFVPVHFSIGTGYADTLLVNIPAGDTVLLTFRNWTASPVGTHIVRCSTALPNDTNPGNDVLIDSVQVRVVVDAGVLEILVPSGVVDSGTTVIPAAVVGNYSTSPKAVPVVMMVGDSYADSVFIMMAPSSFDTVSFSPWQAEPVGTHLCFCYTRLTGDEEPANDTAMSTVTVRPYVDVSAIAILAPSGQVDSGTVIVPEVLVGNLGSRVEMVPVHLIIGSSYQESTVVAIAPDSVVRVSFSEWQANTLGRLPLVCWTALEGDVNPVNDTVWAEAEVGHRHDAGCYAIVAPVGVVDSGVVVVPRAMVANYGTAVEDVPVNMVIDGGYRESRVVTLRPGDSMLVSFPAWVASPSGWLMVRCSTALAGDRQPENDQTTDSVLVVVHKDAAVTDIYAPSGVVDSGTAVVPWARICNYGNSPVVVPVRMRIGDNYDETRTKFLGIGGKDTVMFPVWVADMVGVFPLVCSTMVAGDENPDNDWREDSVRVISFVDAAAVAIVSPVGAIDSGVVIAPGALVANYGLSPAVIPVRMKISDGYESETAALVMPGAIDTVSFAPWRAEVVGRYTVTCSTALAGDRNDANDRVSRSFTVVRRVDGACVAILAPVGVINWGDSVVPRALIANYSTSRQEIPAIMRIGKKYWHTRKMVLDPGEVDTVVFPVWVAQPAGAIAVKCSTALDGDERNENDAQEELVFVRSYFDAGVQIILAPVGVIDSGHRVLPRALIGNWGMGVQVVPVEMRIGDFYRSTREKLLLPGMVDTVEFDEWQAVEVGSHPVRCSTYLAGDSNPGNDFQDAEVDVCWVDAACIAILAPAGAVPVGESVVPVARVRNLGTKTAVIPAVLRYGHRYVWTVWSDSVTPGDSAEVVFPPLVIERGERIASCSTALSGDMNPANDRIMVTVNGITRNIALFADSSATALPGTIVNYFLYCINNGDAADTIDIAGLFTRAGWQVEFLDSGGVNPLTDNNNNGLPDLGEVAQGETVAFVCQVRVPDNELGYVVDSTVVQAISGATPAVRAEVQLTTTVASVVNLLIQPVQFRTVAPGCTATFVFQVTNLGNVFDCADLTYNRTQGLWEHQLLDGNGQALADRNGNGRPDVGPIAPYSGSVDVLLRVVPPGWAQVGQMDTTRIIIWSFADAGVSDEVTAVTEVNGMVRDIEIKPDQADVLLPGEVRDYRFTVTTTGDIRSVVNVCWAGGDDGWQAAVLDGEGRGYLRDTDFDGNPDLSFVAPGVPTQFTLRVTAPEFSSLFDTTRMATKEIWVKVSVSRQDGLCDSARLKLSLVPGFAIYSYHEPAGGKVRFLFSVPDGGDVTLIVYNRLGEEVRRLVDGEMHSRGAYVVEWDGTDARGRRAAPGVYVYRFEVKGANQTIRRLVKKCLLAR